MVMELSDPADQKFLLFEIFKVDSFSQNQKFADFNKKTCEMILKSARDFAVRELMPANRLADKKNGDVDGPNLVNQEIKVPKSYHKPYELFCKGGWLAMCDEEKWGGQSMPHLLGTAINELFMGANPSLINYPGLTHGAGAIIKEFGSETQKKKYLKKLFQGQYAGTMCLTEPQAGSDVGALDTKAVKNEDGTYSIEGNKIFISGADSDLVENIIHPVLAKIEGAPSGTKGISLFLVPKYLTDENGNTLDLKNNVEITGIEEKMGMHGNVTCSVSFGSRGKCIGELIGEENKGMKYMFLMMNEARQGAAVQALGISSASYAYAAEYAKKRVQGPLITEAFNPQPEKKTIIHHPDVRRQLLFMKTFIEGTRFLSYFLKWCQDMKEISQENEEKEKFQGLIELLTPVSKSYTTFKGIDITSTGIQVLGGYGFIEEYPQAQCYRDVRISSLYEGTNGIQAMDLLGRKLGMKKGKPFMDLCSEISKSINNANGAGLNYIGEKLKAMLDKAVNCAINMGNAAAGEKVMDAFGSASLFLESIGDLCMAWAFAVRACASKEKLGQKVPKKDIPFYEGQIITAQFYYDTIYHEALGRMDSVMNLSESVMKMPEAGFYSK
jgi:hypothetical protein